MGEYCPCAGLRAGPVSRVLSFAASLYCGSTNSGETERVISPFLIWKLKYGNWYGNWIWLEDMSTTFQENLAGAASLEQLAGAASLELAPSGRL